MIRHQLPKKNFIRKIEKIPFSDTIFKKYLSKKEPVIFIDLSKNWKANNCWSLDYLINKCGSEKVYTKDIQKNFKVLRHFEEALKMIYHQHVNNDKNGIVIQMASIMTGLFSRGKPLLKALSEDIILPTRVPKKRIMEVNFWAGSGQNITELHYDPVDNLLAVIKGKKNIVIFPPTESNKLYNASPTLTHKSLTHSLVDIQNINISLYPNVLKANYYEGSINEGETLFLPSGYWHVVQSIDLNFAVNIWWLPKITELFKQPINLFWAAEIWSRVRGKGTCVPHSIKKKDKNNSYLLL